MRPAARLFWMRARLDSAAVGSPPKAVAKRSPQASENSRPSTRVMMSMRSGSTPIWKIVPSGREVLGNNAAERRPKDLQGGHHPDGVRRGRPHPHVEVFGRPHMAVSGQSMRAHDQVLNALVVEGAYEIDEVWVLGHCQHATQGTVE